MARRSNRNNNNRNAEGRSVAAHVRDRQRAVAEREASRLARPEVRPTVSLGHADRQKSAVSSTPFGVFTKPTDNKGNSQSQEWCGPFSVARQMIAEREQQQQEEEEAKEQEMNHPLDQAMQELDQERQRKVHPSLQWKSQLKESKSQSLYAKRQKRAHVQSQAQTIPSLFDLCVRFLVDNFEHVESLGSMDHSIRSAITKELVSQAKLDSEALETLTHVGMETLELVDGSQVSQEQLTKSLQVLLPAGLRYLVLNQSGRCFGPQAVQAMLDAAKTSSLFALSIGGAYLLTDADVARLVRALGTLSSLEFKACPLLGQQLGLAIAEKTNGQLLELVLEDVSFPFDDDTLLLVDESNASALGNLKSLSLRRVQGVNDQVVVQILEICGATLQGLDLSHNYTLTDVTLSAIRRYCPNLQSLRLCNLKLLTAAGFETFFTVGLEDLPPPPALVTLDVGRCDHEAVTDVVVDLAARVAGPQHDCRGLVHVDVQGASRLTDTALESLAKHAASSLLELNLSFCTRLSDQGLGYLVDQCSAAAGPQLAKIHIWGCAQLTDDFLDGHSRVNDASLEIVGAWMKKNSVRTIRL